MPGATSSGSLPRHLAPVRPLLVAMAVVTGLLMLAYLVAFDQGAISQNGAFLHELMHDGRHLLGVPCH